VSRLRAVVRASLEAGRVLWTLLHVEVGRRRRGTRAVVDEMRARGRARRRPGPEQAAFQKRLIEWIDVRAPGGANCYRRALLTIALDPDAARGPLRFGLQRGGQPRSGHVWIPGTGDPPPNTYDVEFDI
jgi:hypothetical protein